MLTLKTEAPKCLVKQRVVGVDPEEEARRDESQDVVDVVAVVHVAGQQHPPSNGSPFQSQRMNFPIPLMESCRTLSKVS